MYLPIFNYDDDRHLENVSSKFVYRLLKFHQEAREEADQVDSNLKRAFEILDYSKISSLQSKKQEILEKRAWFELANMIYPLDNNRYTQENGYYQQREWKLPANLTANGVDITEIASLEQQRELLSINKNFFSKKINYLNQKLPRCRISFFLKSIEQKHILEHVNKIIVPRDNISEVKNLLAKYGVILEVEEL